MIKQMIIFLLFIFWGCATLSVDQDIEQIIHEYGQHSAYAQSIPELYTLDESKLWALLVLASEEDRYDDGLAISVRLLDFEPDNDMIYHEMGYFLAQKGLYGSAILFYRKTIHLNPENHAAYYNLGEIYIRQENLSQAQAMLKKAYLLDEDNDQYTIQLAKIYIMQRKYDPALMLYTPVLERIEAGLIQLSDFSATGYRMYADIYYDMALIYFYGKRDSTKAKMFLEQYEELNPNDPDAMNLLAEINRKT